MLLLSEITYENREANQGRLRLKPTLLIPAGPGVFIAQQLWAHSTAQGLLGWGLALGEEGEQSSGTVAPEGGPPKATHTVTCPRETPGKPQENQAVAAGAAHSSLPGARWTKTLYPDGFRNQFLEE